MPPRQKAILQRVARIVAGALLVLLVLILLYRFVNPPFSTLMAWNWITGQSIEHRWVPLDRISRHLAHAVVSSEDGRFCEHFGVDWGEVGEAIEEAEESGDGPRGASTIPMQTMKNLFLWQSRSYVRKAVEVPLAYVSSFFWPKRRMLEIYLNVAEWGPGVFGAEAAARHHFNTSAARLTRGQSALLAVALPNPHVRNAGRPGPKTRRLAYRLLQRLRRGGAPMACVYPQ